MINWQHWHWTDILTSMAIGYDGPQPVLRMHNMDKQSFDLVVSRIGVLLNWIGWLQSHDSNKPIAFCTKLTSDVN